MKKKEMTGIKLVLLASMIFIFSHLSAAPFVPEYQGDLQPEKVYPSQRFQNQERGRNLPENILVLRVEFSDVKFITEPQYPDFLPHDEAYFSKYLEHLSSYYRDNSHGNYDLSLDNFTIHPQVFTAPQTMAFYGEDNSGKTALLVSDLIELADPEIDFSLYDGFIVFHAGAGQEADLTGENLDGIISTFLSRKSFRYYFEPDNEEYPGLETDDDVYLSEFVVCPSTLWQPDNVEPDANGEGGSPVYSFLGVLAHHFGHLIGLPTLFDNVSSNGNSRGIGGFGIMGLGSWNANGYVPAPPSAWSRYYLGWEDVVVVDSLAVDLEITYPNASNDKTKLYKIDISDSEYFLIENSQQNPDGSYFVNSLGDTLVSFTFQLSENQQYYPEGHPYAGQPQFDFMQNSYEGCEWRFYLPGYGYGDSPEMDGSGLLIWHIDELVIAENFSSDFSDNTINGNAQHKGVDLEEADGQQDLDTIFTTVYGSPDDSFRAGNNDYFGKQVYQGLYRSPTAESYYGGNRVEIKNISHSDTIMTFDLQFEWSLSAGYAGEIELPAALIDFDGDGSNEMFYAMPNGELNLWKDDELLVHVSQSISNLGIKELYAWDQLNQTFVIPYYLGDIANYLKLFSASGYENLYTSEEYIWQGSPLINYDNSNPNHLLLAANHREGNAALLKIWDQDFAEESEINFSAQIISNLMLKDNIISFIDSEQRIVRLDLSDYSEERIDLESELETTIKSALWADINADEKMEYLVTTADEQLFVFDENGSSLPNFPLALPVENSKVPALADLDNNGRLQLIYGTENSFFLVDYLGNIAQPENGVDYPDSLKISGGAFAVDLNGDENLEIISHVSRNRLCLWERISDNNFRTISGFPKTFQTLSQSYPLVGQYADYANAAFYPSNNGAIYKEELPSLDLERNLWQTPYGNLQRTASYLAEPPQNMLQSSELFVPEKIYFFPNPLNKIYPGSITNGVYRENFISLNLMTSRSTEVEITIYDVAGNKLSSGEIACEPYVQNAYLIDCKKLASGVYFAVIQAENKVMKKKFAIEK
ncbi:MAG: T9SS type A sorting domain-containing protein [Candidatus Cloacimonadales bacterium]